MSARLHSLLEAVREIMFQCLFQLLKAACLLWLRVASFPPLPPPSKAINQGWRSHTTTTSFPLLLSRLLLITIGPPGQTRLISLPLGKLIIGLAKKSI